jgi:hypothetical protein
MVGLFKTGPSFKKFIILQVNWSFIFDNALLLFIIKKKGRVQNEMERCA